MKIVLLFNQKKKKKKKKRKIYIYIYKHPKKHCDSYFGQGNEIQLRREASAIGHRIDPL